MKYLLTLLFLSSSTIIFSQTIQGTLKNDKSEPISGASVIAYKINQQVILGFSVTDKEGVFKITLKEKQDSVRVVGRSLGYSSIEKRIKVSTSHLDLVLTPSDKLLKELEVKSKPITEEGDTLNYTVDTFAKEGDESIEDVLKRMPGIEVSEDGKISYQGRAINKFYVEGKDLMGGQYAVTSKNLPKNAVASVEVLKDHQPIKMLKDVVNSIDPAINIVLKQGVTVTGNAEVGGGMPNIWYAKATPMVFNKKHQTVNVLSSTNSGQDELDVFNSVSLFDYLEFGLIESSPMFLLGNNPLESSLFKKSEYNDHQTHTVTTNYLTGFGKGDLKVNIDAYHDTRFQDLSSNTFYFVPGDTIGIHNLNSSTFTKKYLNTKLTYEHNSSENYFKNVFHFKVLDSHENADFIQNEEYIPQTSSRKFYSFGDKFSKVMKVGNTYYKMNVYAEYTNSPEQLQFTGGPLMDLSLLNTNPTIQQETHQDHFKSYVGTSIIKKWKKLTLNTKLSLNYEWRTLKSSLPSIQEGDATIYENDLNYITFIPKINPALSYKYKKLTLSFNPNISFQSRRLSNHILNEESQVNKIVFEPSSYIRYNLNGIKLEGNYSYNNNFTELPQMYSGIIVNNFNGANQKHLPILQTKSHSFRGNLGYELTAASLNFYGSYEYNITNKDWISAYEISDEGVALMQTQSFENNQGVNQKIKGNFDWFLLALKSTIKGKLEVGQNEENVILNEEVNRNINQYLNWEAMLDFPIIKGLIISTYYNEYISENIYQELNKVDWSQRIVGAELQFSRKKHLFKWNNKWIDHTFVDDEFLYMDLSYQYKFNKKTRLIFTAQNILDHQSYTQTTVNAFQSSQYYFYLRPRQFMVQVKFSL